MSILTIKYSYAVRAAFFISFLFVMSLGLIGGCSDNGSGGNDSQALTENDFAENSALKADLEEDVVVTFLESPMSEIAENDTGTLGEDDIPVAYDETTQQTFCWEDDDAGAMHIMELRDSEGILILTVQANGDCVNEVIEAGNYIMSIYHDGSNDDSLPIFLIPNSGESGQARESDGLINRFTFAASNMLTRLTRTVTKDALAQTVDVNINTVLRTRRCVGCNLERADFFGRQLSGVNLSGANLSGAEFRGAILISGNFNSANLSSANFRFARLNGANLTDSDLRRANFSSAILTDASLTRAIMVGTRLSDAHMSNVDLSGADLSVADMTRTNLSGANLSGADLRGANLSGANLSGADLSGADFRYVNFAQANLTGVNLGNTDFSFATWCTGTCSCSEGSIDTCSGCTPLNISALDFCTGP